VSGAEVGRESVGPVPVGRVCVGRVYDEPDASLGLRVLVDRLWPRGVSKERARLDEWCKTVAPSSELREWYHHDPARFEEFSRRYRAELEDGEQHEAFAHLAELARRGPLLLLTATKDAGTSEAAVLAELLAP
jgi:uncharacterized protein YeaO (DUF488 family)